MFQTFVRFFTTKEVRNKIFFTLAMLVIFKIGTYIPAPGVNPEAFNHPQGSQGATELLNTFGGGALKRFSIFAMGIMPYITASIVMQLLQMDIVPKFTEWAKQGEMGRRKINNVTRYFAIILAFIQSIGMAFQFNNYLKGQLIIEKSVMSYLLIAVVLTAGTAFLIWLGDQITQFGVGNGISLIIFAGILSTLPSSLEQFAQSVFVGQDDTSLAWLKILGLIVALILLTVGAIFVLEAKRKIPIQYAKKQSAQRLGSQATYLPLKVNSAGVIPVIFAMAFFLLPRTLTLFFPKAEWAQNIADTANPSSNIGMIIYVVLIIAFAYFYAFVQVNPEKMADNLKKQGSYVPGIRPGEQTKKYITKVLYRLTFVGSIFLAAIAILPIIATKFMGLPQSIQIGGTSLLIVIGVAIETMKTLEAQVTQKEYKGFGGR
ncbi:preprotein translocase subunit SecY [Staphylococcus epidermidis]|jgi:preprotein translocase subunit SecY|uniref:Protein translocase subunit SecY n=6 Tax=root TaxID=1 RepID=SECY_STAEQ|nr:MULTISPECIES: preprotein translocase subunit SecY [Staphylococcus]Q5HM19.1 RecName: Full=Protein translocase subunit SecY [Staphylococcus epidermidis RP62A]Q8CNF3.1 RecName: Full=Protein translocase subunit SecY [Staphylococcus epidermidis ATCC 12228]EHR92241.1 preprotein translocase, SecY subunit [Staphylococcus epidermidis VCU123]EID37605.1 preprotein translocase, SecY subunit [Staphylococcus epidermidis IS-250]EJD79252.1 preprotein translocase, SecY subunit [Staphylococcus epidermidis NI